MKVTQQDVPQIIHMGTVASTNTAIRELMETETLPEGSTVWADYQESGRGQMGNSWESEVAKNLTFSILLYPNVIEAKQQFVISQIASLSIKKTLDYYSDSISIKWPNDIYWHDKKLCGMLIENDLCGQTIYCSVIGVGININQEVFVSDAPNPVSLRQITGKKYHREEVLDRFLSIFYSYYLRLLEERHDEIKVEYMNALYRKEGLFPYKDSDGCFMASIEDIESTGHLMLKTKQGDIRRYAFKEVSFLPENNYFCT